MVFYKEEKNINYELLLVKSDCYLLLMLGNYSEIIGKL
jgi:hypothetical protein